MLILLLNRKPNSNKKNEQIKEIDKIIGQQKFQMKILKKALAELNTADKIKIINQLKSDYTVAELCRTFNIARSTYYYRQNNDQAEDKDTENQLYTGHPAYDKDGNLVPEEDVVQLVKDYCEESPHLGYRMVTDYLNYTENLKFNHKRIYRIMKVLDLLQDKIVPKPKEYQLRQKHELTGPDQLWEMDMVQMYIDNSGQWVYMFDIIDVFTRELVGHHESLRCRTKEALKALDEAVEKRDTDDLILRTDNSTQFRSREFQTRIRELDISHERTMVNIPEENANIESFHGILKTLSQHKLLQEFYC